MTETQFQILSDLHLESPSAYDIFHIEPKAPYLVLAGDIGHVKDNGFFNFLRIQLENFRLVFLVLGNHEPYHSTWPETKSRIKSFEAELASSRSETRGQFVLLDQTRYDISPTVTVLGCTLFSEVVPEQEESVSFGLNDFYHIADWSIEAHREAHRADLDWLNREIDSISRLEPERKVAVFTHYCPLVVEDVIDPKHGDSKISSGFMTDLSNECCWKNSVGLWAFGHTHYNCDFQYSGKRMVSNQRGYYFAQATNFDSTKIVGL
ncbi:uncharacterized protein N7515_007310 [Penicillium bovifimosum]|uniref:Calcineurin-like phosphoesterase domain-containing protein n=1 Tax=Penicillium bovifimosum TaxID=126998 RepID=A0A9W9L1J2_9EURO|nr:uncharacterized protein N7515_007310 [Penicillium bovifimosum]KAJ5131271.1 hypothetical protein N7515_007310 [Penicillium bovifimosum]